MPAVHHSELNRQAKFSLHHSFPKLASAPCPIGITVLALLPYLALLHLRFFVETDEAN